MIQFNLLPDVKLEYLKSRRLKRSVILISTVVAGAAFGIALLLFFSVNVLQKQHIKDQNNDIKKYSSELQNTKDLNKILTIQNQLGSLTKLHDDKFVASRLFSYMAQVTPAKVSIATANIDFTSNKIIVGGNADSLNTINKFADTLKFTTYSADGADSKNAFSNVVLSNFSQDPKGGATYQFNLDFDPAIFKGDKEVTLTVPKIISTRSETEKPESLFNNSNGTSQ
ncbi:MAG TPA: hypothetical protein VLE69_01950 [Candidatus Saccharimonadales bacterium]|nr:hypothetical protein [Candidatus Saccharimonadales bacterium]